MTCNCKSRKSFSCNSMLILKFWSRTWIKSWCRSLWTNLVVKTQVVNKTLKGNSLETKVGHVIFNRIYLNSSVQFHFHYLFIFQHLNLHIISLFKIDQVKSIVFLKVLIFFYHNSLFLCLKSLGKKWVWSLFLWYVEMKIL